MAARIVEGLFTCTKRWALEARLIADGHRWPRRPASERAPMSGAECICRILCWLDNRDDPHGRMYGVASSEIELSAQWTGVAGALVTALLDTEWIVRDAGGLRWHDYASLNRITISDRVKKRDKRGDAAGDKEGDKRHKVRDRTGASVSGSGDSSEGIPSERPLAPSARAPERTDQPKPVYHPGPDEPGYVPLPPLKTTPRAARTPA